MNGSNVRRKQQHQISEPAGDVGYDTERQTIEKLVTEEKAKAALQASEPPKA